MATTRLLMRSSRACSSWSTAYMSGSLSSKGGLAVGFGTSSSDGGGRPGLLDFDDESVERPFQVAEHIYVVEWSPATLPAQYLRWLETTRGAPGSLLIGLPMSAIAWRIDPRVRVSVSRRDAKPFSNFHLI